MAKWEYMITDENDKRRPHTITQIPDSQEGGYDLVLGWEVGFEDWLNQLGSEGWEIVAAAGGGAGTGDYAGTFWKVFLKREKSS
jgi:hypothetical protein